MVTMNINDDVFSKIVKLRPNSGDVLVFEYDINKISVEEVAEISHNILNFVKEQYDGKVKALIMPNAFNLNSIEDYKLAIDTLKRSIYYLEKAEEKAEESV